MIASISNLSFGIYLRIFKFSIDGCADGCAGQTSGTDLSKHSTDTNNYENDSFKSNTKTMHDMHPLVRVMLNNDHDLVECLVYNLVDGGMNLKTIPKSQLAIFERNFDDDTITDLCLPVLEAYYQFIQNQDHLKTLPGIQEIGLLYKKYPHVNEISQSIIYDAIQDQIQTLQKYLGIYVNNQASQIGLLMLYNALEIATSISSLSQNLKPSESLTGLNFALKNIAGLNHLAEGEQIELIFYLYKHETNNFISEPHTICLETQKGIFQVQN